AGPDTDRHSRMINDRVAIDYAFFADQNRRGLLRPAGRLEQEQVGSLLEVILRELRVAGEVEDGRCRADSLPEPSGTVEPEQAQASQAVAVLAGVAGAEVRAYLADHAQIFRLQARIKCAGEE